MMRMDLIVGVGAVISGFLHGIMVTGFDAKTIVVWAGWTGLLVMSILGGLMLCGLLARFEKERGFYIRSG